MFSKWIGIAGYATTAVKIVDSWLLTKFNKGVQGFATQGEEAVRWLIKSFDTKLSTTATGRNQVVIVSNEERKEE